MITKEELREALTKINQPEAIKTTLGWMYPKDVILLAITKGVSDG
jgi:hypothetical protein